MVEPPGEQTSSLSRPGCFPLCSTIWALPATICEANRSACARGTPCFTAPSARASIIMYTWKGPIWRKGYEFHTNSKNRIEVNFWVLKYDNSYFLRIHHELPGNSEMHLHFYYLCVSSGFVNKWMPVKGQYINNCFPWQYHCWAICTWECNKLTTFHLLKLILLTAYYSINFSNIYNQKKYIIMIDKGIIFHLWNLSVNSMSHWKVTYISGSTPSKYTQSVHERFRHLLSNATAVQKPLKGRTFLSCHIIARCVKARANSDRHRGVGHDTDHFQVFW